MQNFSDMKAARGGPPRTESKQAMKQRPLTNKRPVMAAITCIRRRSNELGLDYMLFGAYSPMSHRTTPLVYVAKRGAGR